MTGRRLQCVVPFCRRTRGQREGEKPFTDGSEWMCGEHWRMVPKQYRRAYGRRARRWRRFCRPEDGVPGWRLWCRLKRMARERAAGL